MKKTILSIAVLLSVFAGAYANETNPIKKDVAKEKAIKTFNKQFAGATDVTIYDSPEGFIFKSNAAGNVVTTTFDKKGNWIYSVEQFPAHQLLKNVIDIVGLDTNNGFVTGIQKVTQPVGEPVYVIQTQGKDFLKTLRLSNDQLEAISTYKKG